MWGSQEAWQGGDSTGRRWSENSGEKRSLKIPEVGRRGMSCTFAVPEEVKVEQVSDQCKE